MPRFLLHAGVLLQNLQVHEISRPYSCISRFATLTWLNPSGMTRLAGELEQLTRNPLLYMRKGISASSEIVTKSSSTVLSSIFNDLFRFDRKTANEDILGYFESCFSFAENCDWM